MSDASLFIRKRKDKLRSRPSSYTPSQASRPASAALAAPSRPPPSGAQTPSSVPSPAVKAESSSRNVTAFKILSTASSTLSSTRFNLFKLNTSRPSDPRHLTAPVLLNRKHPGPKAPPTWAFDEQGKIMGKFVYDEKGEAVRDELGRHQVELLQGREKADPSLVGRAPGDEDPAGAKRKKKRGVREAFHQDIEVIRLRREENMPWVLEGKDAGGTAAAEEAGGKGMPEHWVGRMVEPSSMPTVLLINEGKGEAAFKVVPMGRTYRFDPERPFKPLDPEAAHKLFEHQAKHKIHDRWAQRVSGPSSSSAGSLNPAFSGPFSSLVVPQIKAEDIKPIIKQEQRALRFEHRLLTRNGSSGASQPRVKAERFDDDYKREGRGLERGLEGGIDEELDYDANEEFQDDEDSNTFWRNEEEEEDAKFQEEQIKKEQRMANAGVGDQPHIEDDDSDSEDLFGDAELNLEGKKLKRALKKRGGAGADDMYDESDEDESDSDETASVKSKTDPAAKDAADKDKNGSSGPSAPNSAERPSRPLSRGPSNRGTSSPTGAGRRPNPPPSALSKAATAPPGSGAALLAQRAASPRRSRQNSPAASVSGSGRQASPPSREASPAPSSTSSTTTASRPPSSSQQQHPAKRKTPTVSPNPPSQPSTPSSGPGTKRKQPSPLPPSSSSASDPSAARKKKKQKSSSATPQPTDPFPGMITRDEVLAWFRANVDGQSGTVPMSRAVQAFTVRLKQAEGEQRQRDNSQMFLGIVRGLTSSGGGVLTLKEEFR